MEITRPVLARRTGQWSLRGIGRQILFYGPIALFLAITFLPIYWILLSAFTPISELFRTPLTYVPQHPTVVNFQTVATVVPLVQQFFNSAVLSVCSAAVTVVICLLAAYRSEEHTSELQSQSNLVCRLL